MLENHLTALEKKIDRLLGETEKMQEDMEKKESEKPASSAAAEAVGQDKVEGSEKQE